jgi:hypothetical protein
LLRADLMLVNLRVSYQPDATVTGEGTHRGHDEIKAWLTCSRRPLGCAIVTID